MTYLADLPVDQLKIDRSFVGAMGSSSVPWSWSGPSCRWRDLSGSVSWRKVSRPWNRPTYCGGWTVTWRRGSLFAAPMSIDDLLLTLQVTEGVLPLSSDG